MIFFYEDVILNHLNRFVKTMEDKNGFDNVEVYNHKINQNKVFYGFKFTMNGEDGIIKLPYIENDLGQFAIDESRKCWTLEYKGEEINNLKTLGDVFNKIADLK